MELEVRRRAGDYRNKRGTKMLKIGIVGGTGRLGSLIIKAVLEDEECVAGAVIGRTGNRYVGRDICELAGGAATGVTVVDNLQEAAGCDCFIDCTNAEVCLKNNYEWYLRMKKPLLIASTGFDKAGMDKLRELSASMPVLQAGNFSMALHDFLETIRHMAGKMRVKADISIIEYHHNQKKDAPSGTAEMIRDAVCDANPLYTKEDIAISSVRGGGIVGEHMVLFAYHDEIIELRHRVSSRDTFAYGALKVCKWLAARENGLYELKDFFG